MRAKSSMRKGYTNRLKSQVFYPQIQSFLHLSCSISTYGIEWESMQTEDILNELHRHAEKDYAAFAQKLIPGEKNILGVRLPRLRALAKKEAKENRTKLLEEPLPHGAPFELRMLRGMLPGYVGDLSPEERIRCIERELPHLNNWSLCDSCCATYHFARRDRAAVWAWLQTLLSRRKEFYTRFVLVMLLNHFLQEEIWSKQCAKLLPGISPQGYYDAMAAAWCACEIILRHPSLASFLLDPHTLSPKILKLTHKKLRESRRTWS